MTFRYTVALSMLTGVAIGGAVSHTLRWVSRGNADGDQ